MASKLFPKAADVSVELTGKWNNDMRGSTNWLVNVYWPHHRMPSEGDLRIKEKDVRRVLYLLHQEHKRREANATS